MIALNPCSAVAIQAGIGLNTTKQTKVMEPSLIHGAKAARKVGRHPGFSDSEIK
jgi:hypothetical protein